MLGAVVSSTVLPESEQGAGWGALSCQLLILKECEVSLTQAAWVSVTVFPWSQISEIAILVDKF